jgi:methionyl-tRNA formyltransferase
MKELRIIFMGTPNFAVGVLEEMVNAGYHIAGVITAPDRPAGRGRKLKPSAVKEYALSQNLKLLQPTNLKDEKFLQELSELNGNIQVVVAFRMLPKLVWDMPEYGTFNLHASLLPQYRGAAPINWAIINQESKTGVTTFFIDEKIDTGNIISKRETDIHDRETAGSLHDKLMISGSELVLYTLSAFKDGSINSMAQEEDHDLKNAPKLNSENTRIDWNLPVDEIDAFIRGLSPFPVAWTVLNNKEENLKVKIYTSNFEIEDHAYMIGTIFVSKKEMKVAAKNGCLYIKEIQLPGKKKMDVISLLNGFTFEEEAKMM